ncbi:MAG: hypothetical protein J4472_01455 [DPANN group archaeon]|nr:hypothetical protein [DPANN group archaeon]
MLLSLSRDTRLYVANQEWVTQKFILSYIHKKGSAYFSELHLALYYASATFRYSNFSDFGFEDYFDDDFEDNNSYPTNDLIRSMLIQLEETSLIEILSESEKVIRLTKKGERLIKDCLLDKSALQDAINEALDTHPIDSIPL